jgi:hypothetical protein
MSAVLGLATLTPLTFSIALACVRCSVRLRLNWRHFAAHDAKGKKRFGPWSVSGESGAESGEKRLAERSRSATPAAEPQTEARRSCGTLQIPLVTRARFA